MRLRFDIFFLEIIKLIKIRFGSLKFSFVQIQFFYLVNISCWKRVKSMQHPRLETTLDLRDLLTTSNNVILHNYSRGLRICYVSSHTGPESDISAMISSEEKLPCTSFYIRAIIIIADGRIVAEIAAEKNDPSHWPGCKMSSNPRESRYDIHSDAFFAHFCIQREPGVYKMWEPFLLGFFLGREWLQSPSGFIWSIARAFQVTEENGLCESSVNVPARFFVPSSRFASAVVKIHIMCKKKILTF